MAVKILSILYSVVRWVPVVFINAVIAWSYYAYVVQLCLFTVEEIYAKVLYLIFYHPLIFIFCWSYWQTIFTYSGKIPKQFFLSRSDVERLENEDNEDLQRGIIAHFAENLPVQCRAGIEGFRYCEKCKSIKPDRAHHCSTCGRCVLKMDHHCPWVNNCVCYNNYKFFILFLGYGLIYCVYVASTSLKYFLDFWVRSYDKDISKFHILFLFFTSAMFAVSLLSLFSYHLYLVLQNRSTLESFRAPIFRNGPDQSGFYLGKYNNFLQVFGHDKKKWALPLFTSVGDGISYETHVVVTSNYNSMDSRTTDVSTVRCDEKPHPQTIASFDGEINYPTRSIDEDNDLLGQRQSWMEEGANDNSGITPPF